MRVFLMRWFRWTTEQFEMLSNPVNCEIRVMQLGEGGEYSLLVHHTREELEMWGLNSDMIADQEWRKTAKRGQWNDHWPWSGTAFFDHFEENEDEKEEEEEDGDFADLNPSTYDLVNGNGTCHGNESTNSQTPFDMLDVQLN